MKLLTKQQKDCTYASGYMDKWVGMMGFGMILSAITSVISTIVSAVQASKSENAYKYSYSSGHSAIVRMSAFPSRSSINFWM